VVVPYIIGPLRRCCLVSVGDVFASPAIKLLTVNVALVVGGRNGAAITPWYTWTLLNVLYSAIARMPCSRGSEWRSHIGDNGWTDRLRSPG